MMRTLPVARTSNKQEQALEQLLEEVRACRVCAHSLPLGPRPVIRARVTARLLIVGQAPGLRVHETGIPWNDPSGDRLRVWLGLDRDTFYDDTQIAIIPAGLCYPGREPRGGDLPPRPECAPLWFERVRVLLPHIRTTLLAGGYAQRWCLGERVHPTLTQTVLHWRDFVPEYFPLPHPSFRNNLWLKNNPWFEKELLPCLRSRVRDVLTF